MEALWLKSHNIPHQDICRLAGIGEDTLRTYLREYLDNGIEALKQNHYRRPQSALAEHTDTLAAYFDEHPPATVAEAASQIKRLTGIERKPTQVRHFLRTALGLRLRKVAAIPAKADPAKQEEFKKKVYIRFWKKPRPGGGASSSWTRLTLFTSSSSGIYGLGYAATSRRLPAASVSTCSALWTQ